MINVFKRIARGLAGFGLPLAPLPSQHTAEAVYRALTYTELALDLALAFHHAVRDDQDQMAATIAGLRENTRGGDFAYYSDITAFMADLPVEEASPTHWIDGAQHPRRQWRSLVTTRRDGLRTSP